MPEVQTVVQRKGVRETPRALLKAAPEEEGSVGQAYGTQGQQTDAEVEAAEHGVTKIVGPVKIEVGRRS